MTNFGDFVTEQEIQNEKEQLEEDKRADEEDNGFGKAEEYDGDEDEIDDLDEPPKLSNPMCDYSDQEQLDRIGNRGSYQSFRGF